MPNRIKLHASHTLTQTPTMASRRPQTVRRGEMGASWSPGRLRAHFAANPEDVARAIDLMTSLANHSREQLKGFDAVTLAEVPKNDRGEGLIKWAEGGEARRAALMKWLEERTTRGTFASVRPSSD